MERYYSYLQRKELSKLHTSPCSRLVDTSRLLG
jgi:hypothetical protein